MENDVKTKRKRTNKQFIGRILGHLIPFEGKEKILVSLSKFWKNHPNLSMYEFSEILRYYRALEFLETKDANFRE